MAQNHFLAGVGRALIFDNNDLIGVALTLTDSTFDFTITGEEIRGGAANALWGKYFHDSNLAVTLTDAMFNLQYMAASLGVDLEQGGLSVSEEQVAVGAEGGNVTVTNTPVAFDGSMIGWYQKPGEDSWQIGTFNEKTMVIPGSNNGDIYCVKYFYQNANARSITIKSQYVPATLHVVIMNDLYAGDVGGQSSATRYGRLITDIPRLQMDGNQNLALTATSAATIALTGSALAISSGNTCEEDPYYGTMTEEIYGDTWQDNVIALAVENGDVELATEGTETLIVRAVFSGNMAAQRYDNSNFTFAVEENPANTATGTSVGANDGIITAGSTPGTCVISVTLTDKPNVEPAYVRVTVA